MTLRRFAHISFLCSLLWLSAATSAWATQYYGQVFYGAVPVPGATVTVTQGAKHFSAVTDQQGVYDFQDLADGVWKIEIQMPGFATVKGQVTVAPSMPQGKWELKLLPLHQLVAESQVTKPLEARPAAEAEPSASQEPSRPGAANIPEAPPAPAASEAEKAANGLLINGSVNNADTSPFSLSPAFGNRRPGVRGLYNGSIGAISGNSIFDARPYSLTGQQTPKSAYNRITTLVTLGGPLRIPHLLPRGPNFFVAYQWTRYANDSNATGLVPDAAERNGNLAGLVNPLGQPVTIYNPATGQPFTGNIPVSPQAAALLNLYPLPNLPGNARYNYQAEVLSNAHTDALQSRLNKTLGHRDQLYGGFGFQSQRSGNVNLFNFLDTTDTLGLDANMNWQHRYLHQTFVLLGYHFTRLRTLVRPEFEGYTNISGLAGIKGNDQDPSNWGPPSLSFASITSLSDANSQFNRNRTDALVVQVSSAHGRHYFTFGGDFRRQEFNQFGQQNPRGGFSFTGAATQAPGTSNTGATGSDLADFLLGIPDTSTIAYGNPDKYFRQSVYDLYLNDDWRMRPELTIDAGVRWDYGAPMTELFGRLVNLDVVPGFSAVAPLIGNNPIGALTGIHYPRSLVRPDLLGYEPRVGISWRPIPASTLVIRAGYGVYDDTSVYLSAAESMSQQAPLSTSFNVANSSTCPLTLANGFRNCAGTTPDNFAIDPNFRVGYAQNWQLSAQRDMPWALVMTLTYMGTKGTRGMQQFLPNTYPIGATNPCPSCPRGFIYRTSGGNSTREAGMIQLRRRLRGGFTATVDYTYAKAIDDDAQVGAQGHAAATTASSTAQTSASATVAQNWLDLSAERGLSTFDQRHLVTALIQYTSGMGLGGGSLMSGWRGRLLKEWTARTQISAGTGFPETPIYLAAVPGTGFANTIRADLTGAPVYAGSGGYHLNAAAFSAPAAGQWGTARRDSITGPSQFSLNESLARTFRLHEPFNLDVRIDATNLLNHAVFTSWNTIVNGTTFGLPANTSGMRTMQITGRLRF